MNSLSARLTSTIRFNSFTVRPFCCIASSSSSSLQEPIPASKSRKSVVSTRVRVSDAQLRENWLTSLSCPPFDSHDNPIPNADSHRNWVIGVDPDVSGAVALLTFDHSTCSPQVFDSPHLQVLVGKRVRRRLDAKSIVQLLRNFNAPTGMVEWRFRHNRIHRNKACSSTKAQKKLLEIVGNKKDDSRKLAASLFPSMSSLLKRKKDHGRAEALLIAAYGKGLMTKSDSPCYP
ncbi:hypothetical protein RJ641_007241 [Dillenia turbinata]|uniref:Uncharacterized protein n=1 Tax=Dillenia turbinata TaxID=194707 RepID=A0AAN8V9Z7_9MAGN